MFIQLDRNGGIPIRKQLYDALTGKILSGALAHGDRLPSTRELAAALGIARNTVIEIYEQLVSEAYLTAASGKGTFVGERRGRLPVRTSTPAVALGEAQPHETAEWGCTEGCIAFASGVPDLSAFPRKAWLKALKESLETAGPALLGYGEVLGHMPLREALSGHLAKYKGIQCAPDQIVIVNGTADAMLLCALLFQKTKREMLVEAAVIDFVPDIFRSLDYRLVPLDIDQEGICTDCLPENTDGLLFCSPSHQFPLGGTLSIDRRLQLADYVRENRHYLIEDDYSSEFRYAGAQVNSLYQLAPDRVIHLGTFSKTLAPFLRLGYMVVPEALVPGVRRLQTVLSRRVNILDQMALHCLIAQGFYARHVLGMGKRYKRKLQCLVSALQDAFGEEIQIHGVHSGLHVAVTFPAPLFDARCYEVFGIHGVFAEQAAEYTLRAEPPSLLEVPVDTHELPNDAHQRSVGACDTLVLGFGNLDEAAIREGIRRLKAAVEQIRDTDASPVFGTGA